MPYGGHSLEGGPHFVCCSEPVSWSSSPIPGRYNTAFLTIGYNFFPFLRIFKISVFSLAGFRYLGRNCPGGGGILIAYILDMEGIEGLLWSTFFVTFMAKFFMQHIVPQMEYGTHCMNVGEHGCIRHMRIAPLLHIIAPLCDTDGDISPHSSMC